LRADLRIQAAAIRRAGDGETLTPDPTVRVLLDRAARELTPYGIDRQQL
jgi:hypothetical protein